MPSSRRASTSAWRPACSIEASVSRVDACSAPSAWRSAPAWTTITLTLWATRSCSSRAMRARSSATASWARSSCSRSSSSARAARASARSWRPRTAPRTSTIARIGAQVKMRDAAELARPGRRARRALVDDEHADAGQEARACRSRPRSRRARTASRCPAPGPSSSRRRGRARRWRTSTTEPAASGQRRRTATGAVMRSISSAATPRGPGTVLPSQHLELPGHHQAGGHDPVELLALGEALHSADANAARRAFHLPNGGSEGAEDRPLGRARRSLRCPTTSRPPLLRCSPSVHRPPQEDPMKTRLSLGLGAGAAAALATAALMAGAGSAQTPADHAAPRQHLAEGRRLHAQGRAAPGRPPRLRRQDHRRRHRLSTAASAPSSASRRSCARSRSSSRRAR